MVSLNLLLDDKKAIPGLYFSPVRIDGIEPINIGNQLATELSHLDLNQSTLPMIVNDIISGILNNNIETSIEGLKYIAIDNIGILFEDKLGLNVSALLKSFSRTAAFFIITHTKVSDNYFFPFDGCTNIKVDLTDIPYFVLHR